jgi:hypothetical protein
MTKQRVKWSGERFIYKRESKYGRRPYDVRIAHKGKTICGQSWGSLELAVRNRDELLKKHGIE